jgi:DNA-binding MarR family transcriptional regulator
MKISAESHRKAMELLNQMKLKEEKPMQEDRTYFKYLAYSSGVFDGMDLTERVLLDIIASCNIEQLTVTDAMTLHHLASPATIHRKLDNLRKAGWIEFEHRDGNRRTKYLVPTKQADAEYKKLNQAVREAVNVK